MIMEIKWDVGSFFIKDNCFINIPTKEVFLAARVDTGDNNEITSGIIELFPVFEDDLFLAMSN